MRVVRPLLVAVAIGLALAGAAACEARLEGAPCPCIMPDYTCVEGVCLKAGNIDASPGVPDGSLTPDAGFFADGGFLPDAGAGTPDAAL